MVNRVRNNVGIVVDGYHSTSVQLPNAFAALGYETVHVRSKDDDARGSLLDRKSAELYRADLKCGDGIDNALRYIEQEKLVPTCIVAGSDTGVAHADRLTHALGLRGNNPATSRSRRHKGAMIQAVADAGLEVIPTLVTRNRYEASEWSDQFDNDIVLKPAQSTGSVGFNRVRRRTELRRMFSTLQGGTDAFGDSVDEIVVQPLLDGLEFAVNSFSLDSEILFFDVWHTMKRSAGKHRLYDFERLIGPNSQHYSLVTEYCAQVLKALDVENGPAHTEIIVTDRGPLLIESAPRLMGAVSISQQTAVFGTSSLALTSEYGFATELFRQRIPQRQMQNRREAGMIQMLAPSGGLLEGYDLDFLHSLESFHGVDLNKSPGDHVEMTRDSFTSPGLIFLVHDSDQQILHDYKRIRAAEDAGTLYRVN